MNLGELNYNIPSNNRELQLIAPVIFKSSHYNIPSNNRELQHAAGASTPKSIITYQVITGNYSRAGLYFRQIKL